MGLPDAAFGPAARHLQLSRLQWRAAVAVDPTGAEPELGGAALMQGAFPLVLWELHLIPLLLGDGWDARLF